METIDGSIIMSNLANGLRIYFDKKSQKEIRSILNNKNIELSQSIISRLLEGTYQVSNDKNKIFGKIADFFDLSPEKLWHELSINSDYIKGVFSNNGDKIRIGITSNALWSAPFVNILNEAWPEWLELAHKHEVNNKNSNDNIYSPIFFDNSNYEQEFRTPFEIKSKDENPFESFYTSGDLLKLVYHVNPTMNEKNRRKFHAILCPDKSVERKTKKLEKEIITLDEDEGNNELVKIGTIVNGFGGVVCIFEKVDKLRLEPYSEDEKIKGYKIVHRQLTQEEVHKNEDTFKKSQEENFHEFLNLLKDNNIQHDFFSLGIKNSASYDMFIEFISEKYKLYEQHYKEKEQQYKEKELQGEKQNKDELLQLKLDCEILAKLKHDTETINFETATGKIFSDIGEKINTGQKLVLVGYSPLFHNIFQVIRKHEFQTDEKSGIILHRFNFSQWFDKSSCSLYISKAHFNLKNFRRLHKLLELISDKRKQIKNNKNLPNFYFYTNHSTFREGNDNKNDNVVEARLLFEKGVEEMEFDKPIDINYSFDFIKLLFKNEES